MKKLILLFTMLISLSLISQNIKYDIIHFENYPEEGYYWRGTELADAYKGKKLYIGAIEQFYYSDNSYAYFILMMGTDDIGCITKYSYVTVFFSNNKQRKYKMRTEEVLCWKNNIPPAFVVLLKTDDLMNFLDHSVIKITLTYNTSKSYTLQDKWIIKDLLLSF